MHSKETLGPSSSTAHKSRRSKLSAFLMEFDDSDDDTSEDIEDNTSDASTLWIRDFKDYMESSNEIPRSMQLLEWWGVGAFFKYSFLLVLTINIFIDECSPIPCMGFTGTRLPCHYGIFSVQ